MNKFARMVLTHAVAQNWTHENMCTLTAMSAFDAGMPIEVYLRIIRANPGPLGPLTPVGDYIEAGPKGERVLANLANLLALNPFRPFYTVIRDQQLLREVKE